MRELPELPPAQRRHVEFHGYSFLAEPFPGCVTNEEAEAYGKACARAAMERAAQIADSYGEEEWMGQDCANRIAAAIRKETLWQSLR